MRATIVRNTLAFLLGLVLLYPFLVPLQRTLRSKEWPPALAGDSALFEIGMIEAMRAAQWLGPYSRYGWRHPGPSCYYVLAPFYAASGGASQSLPFGALAVNLIVAALFLWAVRRHGGRFAFLGACFLLAITINMLGLRVFHSSWNPRTPLLPFALMLVLCASIVLGRFRHLPAVIILGSFALQTHAAYVMVVPLIYICLMAGICSGAREKIGLSIGANDRLPKWLAIAAAAGLIMWLPPLWEEIVNWPGNMTELALFAMTDHPSPSLGQALLVTGKHLAALPVQCAGLLREGLGGAIQSPPFQFDNQPVNASLSWMESFIACAQIVLLFLGMRLGVRAGRPWSSALCFCCLSASIASVWAISNISKPLYGHLCVWAAILGMASWLAIWASCAAWLYGKAGRRLPARAIAAVEICAIVPLACLSIATVKEHYAPRPVLIAAETAAAPAKSRLQLESEAAEELAAALSDFIHANSIQRPLIQIQTPASASMAAGLCLRLARQDIPFAVGLPHLHEYAPRRAPNGNEDIEIVLIDQSLRAAFDARWSYRFIASSGEFSAYSHPTLP